MERPSTSPWNDCLEYVHVDHHPPRRVHCYARVRLGSGPLVAEVAEFKQARDLVNRELDRVARIKQRHQTLRMCVQQPMVV